MMMEIPNDLKKEIWEYCFSNNITNVDDFILKILKGGFTIEKFGSTPNEIIREKIVEKEVEKIVEKEVYLTNDEELKEIQEKVNDSLGKISELENELNIKTNRISELLLEIENLKKKRDIYGEG